MKAKRVLGEKVIILFSGGYDSTVLLKIALEIGMQPYCVLCDYDQVHLEELDYAHRTCEALGVDHVVLKIPILASSRLTDQKATYEGVSPWHVPGRNLIFISLAASIAEARGVDLIWYGANYGDRENLFPDCYQEWVYQVNKVLAMNGSRKITLEAPLLGMSKDLIKGIGGGMDIKESDVFSGYGEAENS